MATVAVPPCLMLTGLSQQHILNRTYNTTPQNNPTRPRTANKDGSAPRGDDRQLPTEHTSTTASLEPLSRTETLESIATPNRELKKGVKAVSFLSRLMGGKKKDAPESARDDESTLSDGRPEGNNAKVFTQNFGYNPRHPQPPAYIKVGARHQQKREFDRVFLAQELKCAGKPNLQRQSSANKLRRKSSAPASDANTIWAMEFSRDGKYLAAAGADKVVRVWAVLSIKEDRQRHEQQEYRESEDNGAGPNGEHLSAPVFQKKPIREFEGHTSTILDLSWSKNNFLLSSSMDKTVRLWHVSRAECLCTFKHKDFIPSIAFHPKDDRFFLAGSLDSKLRLWSIPDKSVAFSAQLPDMITAVAFTPDGKSAMAGCLSGLCMFYETEGLKYQTQVHVRSTRGNNAKGSKITGLQAQYSSSGDLKVLITSNDSRVRLYNFRDKSLELKFRGGENNCSQIRASLSDDGRYIVCGSEDRKAYIWSLHQSHGEKRDKTPVEMFEAHDSITTVVCMAPATTRLHLSRSEDPLYDLCNPPPVTLLSHGEQSGGSISMPPPPRPRSEKAPTESGSSLHLDRTESRKESPAYMSRSAHKAGNIIVTADFNGKIKVFRQDCAWSKRQRDDTDRSSLFSKRGNRSGRPGSLATKASQPSLREPRTSTSTQAPSDRILTWRQGMEVDSTAGSMTGSMTDSKPTSRSVSPPKSLKGLTRINTNESGHGKAATSSPALATAEEKSPSSPQKRTQSTSGRVLTPASTNSSRQPTADDSEKTNVLDLEGDRSYLFWDSKLWNARAERMRKATEAHKADSHHVTSGASISGDSTADGTGHLAVRPPMNRNASVVSRLSDDVSSAEEDEFEDAREDEMKCGRCGSGSFSARRNKDGTRLVCAECGTVA
ncbi:WD repeat-containing protein [Zymoseptoria brevis]|uniref:WD repeat-containing protein n=1 Tax=Zymoseptoria brevis TaxID=1047168 RepID=A0A0F4GMK4_9PEZI|nr:WD repeat-containing protein [Zymoseptoria brevis]